MINPEMEAAWNAVPEFAALTDRRTELSKKADALRAQGTDPERARSAVIAEIAAAVADGSALPADAGKRAAKAYLTALEASAEWRILSEAHVAVESRLRALRETDGADAALSALNVRLSEVLAESRGVLERLGGISTAENAIDAGKGEEFGRLRVLLRAVADIRSAQSMTTGRVRDGIGGPGGLARKVAAHARNLTEADVPADVVRVIQGADPVGVTYLRWIAGVAEPWVPTVSELFDAVETEKALALGEGMPDDIGPHIVITSDPTPVPARRVRDTDGYGSEHPRARRVRSNF
ncbi:hypothetical protein KNE206_18560 [Kitasatospora sp. NE20-6]|uniref:hypothetical protein n=1 Tax=Kitasatospora sp. NE20-6 TaxID=2859066 RepID=UPI0034DC5514